MKTSSRFVIRFGTPDCEWGFPMPDLGEIALDSCYSAFRKHCMEIHGLRQDNDVDSSVYLDLEKWTLTLLKCAGYSRVLTGTFITRCPSGWLGMWISPSTT